MKTIQVFEVGQRVKLFDKDDQIWVYYNFKQNIE